MGKHRAQMKRRLNAVRKGNRKPEYNLNNMIDFLLDKGVFVQSMFSSHFGMGGREGRFRLKKLVYGNFVQAVLQEGGARNGLPLYTKDRDTGVISRVWEANPNLRSVQ